MTQLTTADGRCCADCSHPGAVMPMCGACEQQGCAEAATTRFHWPGHGWLKACARHSAAAVKVGDAMGFVVTVEPLP